MLQELTIQNFAIIRSLNISFQQGLIIFTGETGAGKSIILDALEAVLGGRAEISSIRSGEQKALIEAVFHLNPNLQEKIQPILEAEGLSDNPNYITLSREIRAEGRSIARINGRSVNIGLQREIGTLMVDIHGQSEHLSLLKVYHHLDLLDHYANTSLELQEYAENFQNLNNLIKEYQHLKEIQLDAQRRADMLSYQIKEIESAKLKPGEEDEIRQERNRLSNAETLNNLCQQALVLLDEGTPESVAITDLLGQVVSSIMDLGRIDQSLFNLFERVDSTLTTLSDIALELRNYSENIEFNPKRLDQIEERINLLNGLKRKYGQTISEITDYLDQAKEQLSEVENCDERKNELESLIIQNKEVLYKKGLELSSKRKMASEALSVSVEQELQELSMAGAKFFVDIHQKDYTPGLPTPEGRFIAFDSRGFDQVEFLVETNPGEGLKPLIKIASGGETSRLMLAIKNVLASADEIPVLVFDEIDQGIGGRVGLTVGEKLWQLSRNHQVLCVTHLPQLAAFADQHYQVGKMALDGRTETKVEQLLGEAQEIELAQMIGTVTDGTLLSVNELLQTIQERKSKIIRQE